ncbi:hypothetical protein Vadar_012184 [Vaccinium darrowii]|uniref:Uncharacterized protein n=1 Tax=Vaccinium darrowii TaxID=229202 RepID=A0ACB7Z3Q3_9ERIC|nr:hypothetical protein Vadar_012184 [Vaccinium darrowii]
MALSSPPLQRFLLNSIIDSNSAHKPSKKNTLIKGRAGSRCCFANAINAPSSVSSSAAGVRWGSIKLQGTREEMEDDVVVVRSDDLDGFSYAAVFDGHAGFSSVNVAVLYGMTEMSPKLLTAKYEAPQFGGFADNGSGARREVFDAGGTLENGSGAGREVMLSQAKE